MKNHSGIILLFILLSLITVVRAQCPIDQNEIEQRILEVEYLLDLTKFTDAKNQVDSLYSDLRSCDDRVVAKVQTIRAYSTYRYRDLFGALEQVDEALKYYRSHDDTLSISYADALSVKGEIFRGKQLYEKGKPILYRAKAIYERYDHTETIDYAVCLESLAKCHFYTGDRQAIPLIDESVRIVEQVKGKDHIRYGIVKVNQGAAYMYFNMIDESTLAYEISEKIFESQLGTDHPYYGLVISNLGANYAQLGDEQRAVNYQAKSLSIIENLYGKENEYYLNVYGNYIGSLININTNKDALKLAKEGYDIAHNIKSEYPKSAAVYLVNYGDVLMHKNLYEQAEIVYTEALEIGKSHDLESVTHLIKAEGMMGKINYLNKDYHKAVELIIKADKKFLSHYSKNYRYRIDDLQNLTDAYRALEQSEDVINTLEEIEDILRYNVAVNFGFLSEREKDHFIKQVIESSVYKSFETASQLNYEDLASLLYDMILLIKGVQLESSVKTLEYAFSQERDSSLSSYYQLLELKKDLAAVLFKPLLEQTNTKEIEEEIEAIEKSLARSTKGWDKSHLISTTKDVADALDPREAVIEFFNYQESDDSDQMQYVALILKQGAEQPFIVPLFSEDKLATCLSDDQQRVEDYVRQLYSSEQRGLKSLAEDLNLYELIWEPMAAHLEGVDRLYYSTSGLINRLNVPAISIDDFESIMDRHELIQLSSSRQLIHEKEEKPPREIYLIGGVDYGVSTISMGEGSDQLEQSRAESMGWQPIRWTEREAKNIVAVSEDVGVNIDYLTGTEATEEAFKEIGRDTRSPSVIHLATHGYFYPDPENGNQSDDDLVFKVSSNPLMRSGLIMANGNDTWMGRHDGEGQDGILTAYEISNMNLTDTELVVLSACESGLGDIKGAEGVYGLQRAFKKAGVDKIIMSLWQVPDRETAVFMTTFYEHWLVDEMTIREAFNKTQKEMRDRFFNPYAWAGFVLIE